MEGDKGNFSMPFSTRRPPVNDVSRCILAAFIFEFIFEGPNSLAGSTGTLPDSRLPLHCCDVLKGRGVIASHSPYIPAKIV